MSPQPSEPGAKQLAIDGLRKPARAVVPGPPERRPLAKPAIAPVTEIDPDQLGGPISISQMPSRGTPENPEIARWLEPILHSIETPSVQLVEAEAAFELEA